MSPSVSAYTLIRRSRNTHTSRLRHATLMPGFALVLVRRDMYERGRLMTMIAALVLEPGRAGRLGGG